MRIIFMGTPEFAVPSLDILVKNNYEVIGVITMPDKPAGRGHQMQQSAVKKYAIEHNLHVIQPEKLKDPAFIEELRSLKADLQIVVAFRMLPEVVWNMPHLGTFNLHASLLPQYRGAAPINRALMNGEKETGVTTFFLQHEIDAGKIIYNEKVAVSDTETAGELHDALMIKGAELVLKTVLAIESENYPQVIQADLMPPMGVLKEAPKIFKEDCKINWTDGTEKIYNQIRGLSPYPAAFTELITSDGTKTTLKIFFGEKLIQDHTFEVGQVITDGKTFLKVATTDGFINLKSVQLAGKSRMDIEAFLRGFNIQQIKKMV